jgi:hypothetical protein
VSFSIFLTTRVSQVDFFSDAPTHKDLSDLRTWDVGRPAAYVRSTFSCAAFHLRYDCVR